MGRVTDYRSDPELAELLVTRSLDTMLWMRRRACASRRSGAARPSRSTARFKFWGGLTVEASGGGPGLVDAGRRPSPRRTASRSATAPRAVALALRRACGVHGVRVKQEGKTARRRGQAVVLACGGFEANAEWRTRYLGPGLGARQGPRHPLQHRRRHPHGARHRRLAARQLVRLPRRRLGPQRPRVRRPRRRRRLPEALLPVRHHGQRHGQALRRRGRRLPQLHLRQVRPRDPGAAGPVRLAGLRRARSCTCCATSTASSSVTKVAADTLEELAAKLEGVDAAAFLDDDARLQRRRAAPTCRSTRTSRTAAAPRALPCRSRTGRTRSTSRPSRPTRSTCGITFTFGGLRIDAGDRTGARQRRSPIPGLYAAGELVGGLFYFNYPGGTGLMSGAVFGRIAGMGASRAIAE